MLYSSFAIFLTLALPSCFAQQVVQVNLRVEGASTTLFEGVVKTNGHRVFTPLGGTHSCDGTNNTKNIAPGPTMTSALDNATFIAPELGWDGPFNCSLRDYDITSIGGEQQSRDQAWNLLHNFNLVTIGGCQERVFNSSNVLFAFGAIGPDTVFLNLTGPTMVSARQPALHYTVYNGNTNDTVAGAVIPEFGLNASGDDGIITVFFSDTGNYQLKAERSDSIRSNAIHVGVFDEPPNSSSTTGVPTSSSLGPVTTVFSSIGPSTSIGL